MEEINASNFQEKVLDLTDGKLVLVDFSAEWCHPCTQLEPALDAVHNEEDVTVYKIDVDENQELTQSYGVDFFPTVIFFRDGEAISVMHGNLHKDMFIDRIFRLNSQV